MWAALCLISKYLWSLFSFLLIICCFLYFEVFSISHCVYFSTLSRHLSAAPLCPLPRRSVLTPYLSFFSLSGRGTPSDSCLYVSSDISLGQALLMARLTLSHTPSWMHWRTFPSHRWSVCDNHFLVSLFNYCSSTLTRLLTPQKQRPHLLICPFYLQHLTQ